MTVRWALVRGSIAMVQARRFLGFAGSAAARASNSATSGSGSLILTFGPTAMAGPAAGSEGTGGFEEESPPSASTARRIVLIIGYCLGFLLGGDRAERNSGRWPKERRLCSSSLWIWFSPNLWHRTGSRDWRTGGSPPRAVRQR